MGTVVALSSRGGVAIAGDSQAVVDGTVRSQSVQRVFESDSVGAGVVGEMADIQTFRRELEAELHQLRTERGDAVGIDTLGRIAARLADESNVGAVIAGHDDGGVARLREVGPGGETFEQTAVALGDGAELAAGQLEAVGSGLDIDATVATVTEILEGVGSRSATSGGDITHWSLPNAAESRDEDGQ